MDAADTAELHTPPMNKIGLPDGMTEYAIRRHFRDLIEEIGADQADATAAKILADEIKRARQ